MWISKKEYKALQNRLAYYEDIQQHCMNLMQENSNLRNEINKLAYKIATNKEKRYEVTVIARGSKTIQYTISAISHDDAYEIAVEQFQKDNLNYSKEDIVVVNIKKI